MRCKSEVSLGPVKADWSQRGSVGALFAQVQHYFLLGTTEEKKSNKHIQGGWNET